MANPILRAGPYASQSNYFITNYPSGSQVFNNLVLPVNCNTTDWVNDQWKAMMLFVNDHGNMIEELFGIEVDGTLTFNLGSIDRDGDNEGIYFGYQAVNDFTLTGTFSASPFFGGSVEDFGFQIGNVLVKDKYFFATTLTGTFSVTLPKAIVPKFVNLSFSGQAGAIDGAQIVINNLQPRL